MSTGPRPQPSRSPGYQKHAQGGRRRARHRHRQAPTLRLLTADLLPALLPLSRHCRPVSAGTATVRARQTCWRRARAGWEQGARPRRRRAAALPPIGGNRLVKLLAGHSTHTSPSTHPLPAQGNTLSAPAAIRHERRHPGASVERPARLGQRAAAAAPRAATASPSLSSSPLPPAQPPPAPPPPPPA